MYVSISFSGDIVERSMRFEHTCVYVSSLYKTCYMSIDVVTNNNSRLRRRWLFFSKSRSLVSFSFRRVVWRGSALDGDGEDLETVCYFWGVIRRSEELRLYLFNLFIVSCFLTITLTFHEIYYNNSIRYYRTAKSGHLYK